MFQLILLCCALIADDGKSGGGDASDRAIYQSAQSKAGDSAAAHAKLALWCEAHGLTAERAKHLARAIALDPANLLARGLSGLLDYQGKLEKPDAVMQDVRRDAEYQAVFRQYLERRVRTPITVEAQLRLAAWCRENGLKEQAVAHYRAVLRLDPNREVALRHLGYQKHAGRWVKPDELAAEKQEAEHQKHADAHWRPRLERIREGLESPHKAQREKAEKAMAEVADPRAVPLIGRMFATGTESSRHAAIAMAGQIEGPRASTLLASLAVFDSSPDVRRGALETMVKRDPRDVVGRLIALVHRPFKYEVRPGAGPGSTSKLLVDGEAYNIERLYRPPTLDVRLTPFVQVYPNEGAMTGAIANAGVPVRNLRGQTVIIAGLADQLAVQRQIMIATAMEETRRRDLAVQQTLTDDLRAIEAANDSIKQLNERVLPVVTRITGADFGSDQEAWQKWWSDQLGYVYQSSEPSTKPTLSTTVSAPDITLPVGVQVGAFAMPIAFHGACFGAGTLVQTIDGPRRIESIQLGDRVLSEDTSTGALVFDVVVATHVNGPSPTLRITTGDESIVATGIHRFWSPGKGWKMAHDLKSGDQLRRLGGVLPIKAIEDDQPQLVYNLDVAGNRDFLVGQSGILVHDFSFVRAVPAPFDRQDDLKQAASN